VRNGVPGVARYRGNVQTVGPNGAVYPSRKQANRAAELYLLQRCGAISELQEEVDFELIPKQNGERACKYRADFVYIEDGKKITEDCKGFRTEVYRLKRKLMKFIHGVTIRET
jgi:hypothetical protein